MDEELSLNLLFKGKHIFFIPNGMFGCYKYPCWSHHFHLWQDSQSFRKLDSRRILYEKLTHPVNCRLFFYNPYSIHFTTFYSLKVEFVQGMCSNCLAFHRFKYHWSMSETFSFLFVIRIIIAQTENQEIYQQRHCTPIQKDWICFRTPQGLHWSIKKFQLNLLNQYLYINYKYNKLCKYVFIFLNLI